MENENVRKELKINQNFFENVMAIIKNRSLRPRTKTYDSWWPLYGH